MGKQITMKLQVIELNSSLKKKGEWIFYFGIGFLLLNIFFEFEKSYLLFTIAGILGMLSSFIIINYVENHPKVIGSIEIHENNTIVKINKKEVILLNLDYNVKLADEVYKGESGYNLFFNVGLFTSKSGNTTIIFYSESNTLEYHINISSLSQLKLIKRTLENHFNTVKANP